MGFILYANSIKRHCCHMHESCAFLLKDSNDAHQMHGYLYKAIVIMPSLKLIFQNRDLQDSSTARINFLQRSMSEWTKHGTTFSPKPLSPYAFRESTTWVLRRCRSCASTRCPFVVWLPAKDACLAMGSTDVCGRRANDRKSALNIERETPNPNPNWISSIQPGMREELVTRISV